MTFSDTFSTAIAALMVNKLRSALTLLGVVIGVGAVIALMAIGEGATRSVTNRFSDLGSNVLFIQEQQVDAGRPPGSRQAAVSGLTLQDAHAMENRNRFSYVDGVAPQSFYKARVSEASVSLDTTVYGVTPEYQWVRNFFADQGKFIDESEMSRRSLSAVLGSKVAQDLFGEADPLGQSVRIAVKGIEPAMAFRVIGVMEEKGSFGGSDRDDAIFIPLSTMQAKISADRSALGLANVMQISVSINDPAELARGREEIAGLLRERHRTGEDDFSIRSQEELLKTMDDIKRGLMVFMGSIASIALLVGGIGIMNIMLVSVTERTREVGIRKALGARRRDIVMQFLAEAVMVTMVGGLIGVALGVLGAAFADGKPLMGGRLVTVVTTQSIAITVGVSVAIGIFFGIYPAFRAAGLNPVEALRHE
ncbi:MAG: ABC transporter permease [Chloroflexi bacterium]|nr:ABC transporter permease [Chloroflexota bacterium]